MTEGPRSRRAGSTISACPVTDPNACRTTSGALLSLYGSLALALPRLLRRTRR